MTELLKDKEQDFKVKFFFKDLMTDNCTCCLVYNFQRLFIVKRVVTLVGKYIHLETRWV